MKAYYKTFEKKFQGKDESAYINYAVSLIGCCPNSMAFILQNKVDFVTGENFLLVSPYGQPESLAFKMYYCQFCGKKHESEYVKDDDEPKSPPIPVDKKQKTKTTKS